MTVERLLQPRYKVIADYPNSDFEIGFILYSDKNGFFYEYGDNGRWSVKPEKYPHIFKKLEWYEERKVEDMPEYVKELSEDSIKHVAKWKIDSEKDAYYAENGSYFVSAFNTIPATEQEYLQFKNSL